MTDDPAIIETAARALAEAKADRGRKYATLVPGLSRDEAQARAVLTAVTPLIRAAALEQAAKVAEDYDDHWGTDDGENIAAAIRALKEQP